MIPGKFGYHRPQSVAEAVGLLASLGSEARALAGGHSLIPLMKLRMAQPEHLVDLRRVTALKGIRREGADLVIGAMTTQAELIASALLADLLPLLPETCRTIADPQIRNVSTIGGNVANGDPGNDLPAVMQCLGASFILDKTGGQRSVAARDFYLGPYTTALAEGELLTGVRIPIPPAGHGAAYEKLKRKVGDYATAAAAVVLTMTGGRCTTAAIALTNLGGTPLMVDQAAAAIVGTALDQASLDRAAAAASAVSDPAEDARGSVEYRRHVAGVMTRRAILRAAAHANQRSI